MVEYALLVALIGMMSVGAVLVLNRGLTGMLAGVKAGVTGVAPPVRIDPCALYTVATPGGGGCSVGQWGLNDAHQVTGTDVNPQTIPIAVPSISPIKAVAAGAYNVLVLLFDGTVWTWGDNRSAQLGLGDLVDRTIPTQITGLRDVKAIEAGDWAGMALDGSGNVWTWGRDQDGEAGDGRSGIGVYVYAPIRVNLGSPAKAIAAGHLNDFAILASGVVKGWGDNIRGQVGTGTPSATPANLPITTPTTVSVLPATVTQILPSREEYFALAGTDVYAWGFNANGELGLGYASPTVGSCYCVATPTINMHNVRKLWTGGAGGWALSSVTNNVYGWGANDSCFLGDTTSTPRLTPTLITKLSPPNQYIAQIAGGQRVEFSLALTTSGQVLSWGDNTQGALGNGRTDTADQCTPTAVPGETAVVSLAPGGLSSYVVNKGMVGSG